jgi:hypothetical protein
MRTLPITPARQIRLLLPALCLLALTALAACTQMALQNADGPAARGADGMVRVLLGVECTVDRTPRTAFPAIPLLTLSLASFETFGEFKSFDWRRLPAQASGKDWIVFRLRPGNYYLRIYGPAAGPQSEKSPASFWLVMIPDGPTAIYVGSLTLEGRSLGRNFLGIETIVPAGSRSATLADESEQAQAIASRHLPDPDGIRTILLQPWQQGTPMIFRTPKARS